MRELISTIEDLLVSASTEGGDAKQGADVLLNAVDWKKAPQRVEPQTFAIVEQRFSQACAAHGEAEGHAASLCRAAEAVCDGFVWEKPWGEYLDHADMAALVQNFAYTTIIGPGCILDAENVSIGLSLQGPDLHYPMHAHRSDELYWIIGGDGDWKIGIEPWFAVRPGDTCVHPSGMRHAMQTNAMPLLTVWAWWSHIDANIVMIRG